VNEHVFPTGIVFSLEDGRVWASWESTGARVCLGLSDEASDMMADFLAQSDAARRLLRGE
jgi:hypothetical protein